MAGRCIVSRAKQAATETVAAPAEIEELPFPPLAARLIGEVLSRHRQEADELVIEVARHAGITLSEGWQVDVQGGRFVRPAVAAGEE